MSPLRAMQLQLAEAMLTGGKPSPACLCGDERAGEATRLAVYQQGYRIRLREALAVEFPGLALLAGQRFASLLDDYVAAQPSRHFNIRWHGEGLASFLARTSPWCARTELAEMAQLDWAVSTAFDAFDHDTLGASELSGVAAQSWPGLRLHGLPHARVLPCHSNVDAFRRAADRNMPRPRLRRWRRPGHLLIWRPALEVHYRRVPPAEVPLLQAALHGETFAQLCGRLAERHGSGALPQMAALLGQWLDEGLLGGFDLAEDTPM